MSYQATHEQLAHYAKALAHPARVAILELLLQRESCVCGELVGELPLSQASVSQHLRAMKEAGLIVGEVEGRNVCYCLDEDAVRQLRALFGGLAGQLQSCC